MYTQQLSLIGFTNVFDKESIFHKQSTKYIEYNPERISGINAKVFWNYFVSSVLIQCAWVWRGLEATDHRRRKKKCLKGHWGSWHSRILCENYENLAVMCLVYRADMLSDSSGPPQVVSGITQERREVLVWLGTLGICETRQLHLLPNALSSFSTNNTTTQMLV